MSKQNKVMKFAIFILAFLVVLMLFVFIFVIPGIKEYKTKKAQYYYEIQQKKRLEEQKKSLSKELQERQKRYENELKRFQNDFNESEFIAFAKKYFTNVKITPKNKEKIENGLQIYEFSASFNAQTPVKFYEFVQNLQNPQSIVKINFPIRLDAQGGIIQLRFNMSVYRLPK